MGVDLNDDCISFYKQPKIHTNESKFQRKKNITKHDYMCSIYPSMRIKMACIQVFVAFV